MKIPLLYSVRSLLRRPATSASTAAGIALVVLTFVAMLSLANGFRSTLASTGRADNVLLLRAGSDSELMSWVSRPDGAIVRALPGIARGDDGAPLVTGDVYVVVSRQRRSGGETSVSVRGVDAAAFRIRDVVHLTTGRLFRIGRPEVIVGRTLARRVPGLEIGDRVRFGQEDFTVVGQFEAAGSMFESEIWGENEQLMNVFRGPIYESMTFRLADPARFDEVRRAILADPRLNLDVYRESDFFARQSAALTSVLRFLAFFVTGIMAIGAIFGAINTMDALIGYRTREIALLLTLGFRPRSVLAAFLLEALLLAGVGGAAGLLLALPINGIATSSVNMQSMAEVGFQFRISAGILTQGMIFAILMGLLGGFLPARRAARQVLAQALRAE